MTILSYKGYQGQVSFEKGLLLIELLHVDDSIMCECHDLHGVQAAFEELVDDYIATCKLVGKEPQKPFKGSFNVRVGPDLHRRAAVSAVYERETLNAWVMSAIEAKLQELDRRRQPVQELADTVRLLRLEHGSYTQAETVSGAMYDMRAGIPIGSGRDMISLLATRAVKPYGYRAN